MILRNFKKEDAPIIAEWLRSEEVAKMLKAIHAQESKKSAREKARAVVEELRSMKLKEAAKKVEDGIEETLTYCDFPGEHWTRIRTNNVIERLTFAKPVPEFYHSQRGIPPPHVSDELQFRFCVLVWVVVRASGLAGQRRHTSIPACLPEVDIRPTLVVFPACTAHAIFGCILH